LINCPACGSNFEGDLCLGCPSCGGRAVGPPLARAEHQLTSFGRAVVVAAAGFAMAGVFLGSVIGALIEFGNFPPRFGVMANAGEVASWRLKWVMMPAALIVLWGSARLIRSIKASPERFIGLRAARLGFASSAAVTILVATLIGITMPVRLERRQWGIEAARTKLGYTYSRALLEYRELHGTLPLDNDKVAAELRTLPDPDGSIAEALQFFDANGYQVGTVLAAASTKSKSLVPQGSAIRKASMSVAPATDHGVSFTSYDLRLTGEDKVLNTDDDLIIHDGLVMTVPEYRDFTSSRTRVP